MTTGDAIAELTAVSRAWDAAMERNDADEIADFVTADWIIVGSGGITARDAFIEQIRSGTLSHSRMDSDEMHVRVHGNTGTVVSRGTSAGQYRGEQFELYEWSTSVFVRDDARWRCVLTMLADADRD